MEKQITIPYKEYIILHKLKDILIEKSEIKIFHGGCHGCLAQILDKSNFYTCEGCKYYSSDNWRNSDSKFISLEK